MQTSTQKNNDFKIFLPVDIQKGKNAKGEKVYKISGQASKQRKDSQGEVMSLDGMDVSDLKIINWNHKSKDNPNAYIGEVQGVTFKDDVMLFNGELYPEMPMANGAITLMKALKKRGKQLGISIEGTVVERGSKDKKNPKYNTVVKSKLTALALTPNPINSDTYAELVEKGYTENNDWEYDDETEILMKSFEEGDLEKAYTVEENQDMVKEDVEGPKNKKKKEDDEDDTSGKESLLNKISKADTYEKIFNYFYGIDIKKAQSIYNLIEKVAKMEKKEITQEAITKAFDILETSPTGSPEGEEITKSEEELALEATAKEKEKEEYDGMVSKATDVVKVLMESNSEIEKSEVVEKMIEKGFGEKVINEAYDAASGVQVLKSDNTEVLKALETMSLNSNKKFSAISEIFKSQSELLGSIQTKNTELEEKLEKSFDTITELNSTIQSFAQKPGARRSAINFKDKNFTDEEGQKIEKGGGDNDVKAFDLKNETHRQTLITHLTEQSGINKGGDYDKELMNIAQGIEIAKSVDEKAMGRLNAMGIEILA